MKKIRFYEYSKPTYNSQENCDIDDIFSVSEIKYLDYLNKSVVRGQEIFQVGQKEIRAKNYVGILAYPGVQIEILPKLLKDGSGEDRSILKNLMHMLSYTHKLEVQDSELADLSSYSSSFIEAYINIFASRLLRTLRKKGPMRYTRKEENLKYVKGRISFPQHIRLNLINKALTYCEYDEYSENNILSQTFKYVSNILIRQTSNVDSHKKLKEIRSLLADVSDVVITKECLNKINISRSNQEFLGVFNLAKMFLSKTSSLLANGKQSSVSILFDMNELFEEYIFEYIRVNKEKFGISKVEPQRGKRLIDGAYEIIDSESERKIKDTMMNTFTDVVVTFDREGESVSKSLIIDTKYKLLNDDGHNHFNIKNTDIYQVLTYKLLHSSEKVSTDVALLYPKNTKDHKMRLSVAGKESVYIYTIDLHKDLGTENDSIFNDLNDFLLALAA